MAMNLNVFDTDADKLRRKNASQKEHAELEEFSGGSSSYSPVDPDDQAQKLLSLTGNSESSVKGNNFLSSSLKRSGSIIISECEQNATIGILHNDLISTKENKKFNVSIRKCNTEFPLPLSQSLLDGFLKRRSHEFIRIAILIGVWKPNVTHISVPVTVSIMDHRREEVQMPSSDKALDTLRIPNKSELACSTVSFDSDKMMIFGMNMGNWVHKRDLKDIMLHVSMGGNVTKEGRSGAKISFYMAIDESSENTMHEDCIVEPFEIPKEKVSLIKDYRGALSALFTTKLLEKDNKPQPTLVEKFKAVKV